METKEKTKFRGPLNITIGLVQLESFMNKINKQMKEKNKEALIKILIALSPITIGFIAYVISKQTLPLLIGTTITGLSNITLQIREMRHTIKKEKKLMNKLNTEGTSDELQTSQIRNIEEDMFFSEALKEKIQRNETVDLSKYRESLEQKIKSKNNVSLVKDKVNKQPTKESQIEEIFNEIELLQILYTLPIINIELKEWEIFFDEIYNKLKEKELQEKFKEIIITVCHATISKALINNQESLTIKDFLDNLYYFEISKYRPNNIFQKKELLELKRKIAIEINHIKSTEFQLKQTE